MSVLSGLFSEDEEEQVEASVADGIPRYGESNAPDWAGSLEAEVEHSAMMPEALSSEIDERDSRQRYASSDIAIQENVRYSDLKVGPKPPLINVAKTDPDETALTHDDLYAPAVSAMTIPNAEAPIEEGGEPWGIRDGVNFLFGEDMAIMGVKWDEEGLNFSMENAMAQWSEHPIMSSLTLAGLVASAVFPAVGAVRKSAKVGRLAMKNADHFVDAAQAKAKVRTAYELAKTGEKTADIPKLGFQGRKGLKEATLLEHGDKWDATLGDLAKVKDDYANEYSKFFDGDVADEITDLIGTGRGEEALVKFGQGSRSRGIRNIKKTLLAQDHADRQAMLSWKVSRGMASGLEQAKHGLLSRFQNKYWGLESGITPHLMKKITGFFNDAEFGKLFSHVVDEADHKSWYKYMHGFAKQGKDADLDTFIKKNPKQWDIWQKQRSVYKDQQAEMIDKGFLTLDEVNNSSLFDKAVHVKVETGSAAGVYGMSDFVAKKRGLLGGKFEVPPQLAHPGMAGRIKYKGQKELLEAIEADELVMDPAIINNISLARDKIVLNTYDQLGDLIAKQAKGQMGKETEWFMTREAFRALPDKAKGGWVDMNDLGGEIGKRYGVTGAGHYTDRLRRIVAKKMGHKVDRAGNIVGDMGDLPMVHSSMFDEFFDPEAGIFGGVQVASDALSMLTSVHKVAKTALNPRTHLMNVTGNFVMLGMAGMNPFSKQALKDGHDMTRVLRNLSNRKISGELTDETMFKGKAILEAFEQTGVERKMKTAFGTEIDLAEDLMDPMWQQLIEKQAFETQEGFANLEKTIKVMQAAREADNGKGIFAELMAKGLGKLAGITGKEGKKTLLDKTLHHSAAAYLQEDMIPKAMYMMNLRRSGMSVNSAAMEVGRRLPQYKTVGAGVKGARKWMLPWVTFPAEMTRIMKNNMLDYPMRTAGMIRLAPAIQAAYGMTHNMSPEDITEGMKEAPMWANNANSVLVEGGNSSAAMIGGFQAALSGAILGGAKAGVKGAMVGAAGAGLVMGGAAMKFGKEEEDAMRSWTMDFLPWASLQPKSKALEAEPHNMRSAMDLSPMEPMSILMPLMDVFMGDAGYGQEIPVTGMSDSVSKAVLGFAGFLAPPMIQKYGMRVGGPDTGFFDLADAGGRLGAVVLGATAGAVGGIGGGAGGVAAGAAAGGVAGLMTGANTSRLEEDIGIRASTSTGEPGNWIYDVVMNQWLGAKAWKSTPEQRIFNEQLRNRRFSEARRVWQKDLDSSLMNGDEDMFNRSVGEISRSFTMEHMNPMEASRKTGEYFQRRLDKIGQHPRLKGMSVEQLESELNQAQAFDAENRGKFMERKIEALRHAKYMAEIARESSGMNVGGYDYDVNLATGLKMMANRMAPKKKKKKGGGGGLGVKSLSGGGLGIKGL